MCSPSGPLQLYCPFFPSNPPDNKYDCSTPIPYNVHPINIFLTNIKHQIVNDSYIYSNSMMIVCFSTCQ